MSDPVLDETEIQGHVFPGFGTCHSAVIALRLENPEPARRALAALLPSLTPMSASLEQKDVRRDAFARGSKPAMEGPPSLSISLAASALRAWGHDLGRFDPSFQMGMLADAEALGDPLGADRLPADWVFGRGEADRVDVLLVAGHSESRVLRSAVDAWLTALAPHLKVVLIEYGKRRPGDREFFGFADGVSQPALRGVTSRGDVVSRRTIADGDPRADRFAKPGQLLIWPGAFLFGHPQQTSSPTTPGIVAAAPAEWMDNGSYLVFRRLLQDAPAFRAAVSQLEQFLEDQGETVPEGWTAARMIGRWPDATPLSVSPSHADPDIGTSDMRNNNFLFAKGLAATPLAGVQQPLPAAPGDPTGTACPFIAHIRKVNPRDGMSEIGTENNPRKLMLRRGIAFGPDEGDDAHAERGLLFLSYQTSITDQFHFVQVNWANSALQPGGHGRDPLIGQDGTAANERELEFFGPGGVQRLCRFDGRWVVATGGQYLVAPSMSGLRTLLGGEPGTHLN